MNHTRKYIRMAAIALAMVFGLSSCSQEDIEGPENGGVEVEGDNIILTGSIVVPEMPKTATRGVAGDKPGADLKLTLLEFSKGADGSNSFLTNIYQAETLSTTAVANGAEVTYSVTLKNATEGRVLHLMVADEFISCDYGSEAELLPAITVSAGADGRPQEAYWGKVIFPDGYSDVTTTTDGDGNQMTVTTPKTDELKQGLSHVPVIRNFSRVTIANHAADFVLEGFQLVNVPQKGSIAPWNATTLSTPELLDGSAMKSYEDIGTSYSGIVPAATEFANQESEVSAQDGSTWSTDDAYFYEHPYESSRHTYIIVKGRYKGGASSYYMVDLGYPDASSGGMFRFYNLLRNISYDVTINEVRTSGAPTPSDAIRGLVYNNLSASVQTSAMLNVSDGTNLLVVSATSIVFVNDQPIEFMYRYREGLNNLSTQTSLGKIGTYGLAEGDVIKSFSTTEYRTIDGDVWAVITITPNTPGDVTKIQSFTVVDPNGLGRTINLVSHTPWNISELLYNNVAEVNYDLTASSASIGTAQKAAMTLFIDLPDGLPESIFPLEFTVEDGAQQLENNPVGNMRVSSGPSLVDDTKVAIQYIKPVTYQDYLYRINSSGSVDVGLDNTRHRIPCRMLTITSGTTGGTIYVSNPYFNTKSISYSRQ